MDLLKLNNEILNSLDSAIYVTDIDTREVVYINKYTKKALGLPDDESYVGRKCSDVLRGFAVPCKICKVSDMDIGESLTRQHFDASTGKYYSVKETKLEIDGRRLCLTVTVDVTQCERDRRALKESLDKKAQIIRCMEALSGMSTDTGAVDELLALISDYYDGDRGYIFEIDRAKGIVSNTYEWCADGVKPQIDNLRSLPIHVCERWLEAFSQGEIIEIESLEDNKNSVEYEILKMQDINNLLAAPLLKDGDLIGFIGIDNPRSNTKDRSFIESLVLYVSNEIEKRNIIKKLENYGTTDVLTKVFNRNRYIADIKQLRNVHSSVGVAFIDMNGLKIANDTYGHDYGDTVIRDLARIISAEFPNQVYRIGGDEFVAICRGLTREDFERKADTLRTAFAEKKGYTVSIGAEWTAESADIDYAIKEADRRMYAEKQSYYERTII